MIDEKEIEAIADKIRHDKTARKDFCKRVGISEDEFFINQNGDFEIEDMERAYRMGTENPDNANQSGDFRERYEKQKQINLELAEENEGLKNQVKGLWLGFNENYKRLADAKKIIKDFYESVKGNGTTCVNTGTRFINVLELVKQAEAFLKESES